MAVEFTIESSTAKALKVRHVAAGHHFTFRVSDPSKTPRFLRRDYFLAHASNRAAREEIKKAAHAFAELEARKADLID
jgi:hypothetical protein